MQLYQVKSPTEVWDDYPDAVLSVSTRCSQSPWARYQVGCTGLCHKTMALIALSEISLLTSLLSLAPRFSLGFIWGTMSVIILGLLFAFFFFFPLSYWHKLKLIPSPLGLPQLSEPNQTSARVLRRACGVRASGVHQRGWTEKPGSNLLRVTAAMGRSSLSSGDTVWLFPNVGRERGCGGSATAPRQIRLRVADPFCSLMVQHPLPAFRSCWLSTPCMSFWGFTPPCFLPPVLWAAAGSSSQIGFPSWFSS